MLLRNIVKLIFFFLFICSIQACKKISYSNLNSEEQEESSYIFYLYEYQDKYICQYRCSNEETAPQNCDKHYIETESSKLDKKTLEILQNPSNFLEDKNSFTFNNIISLFTLNTKKVTGDICNNNNTSEEEENDISHNSLIRIDYLLPISLIENTENDTWDKYFAADSNDKYVIYLYKKNKNNDKYFLLSNENVKCDKNCSNTKKTFCFYHYRKHKANVLSIFESMVYDIKKYLDYLKINSDDCIYIDDERCLALYAEEIIPDTSHESKNRLFTCDIVNSDKQLYFEHQDTLDYISILTVKYK